MKNLSLISLSLGLIPSLSPLLMPASDRYRVMISNSLISKQFSSFYLSYMSSDFQARSTTFRNFLSTVIKVDGDTYINWNFINFGNGAIHNPKDLVVIGCKFLNCQTSDSGGGIYIYNIRSTFNTSFSIFSSCSAYFDGGGMYISINNNISTTINSLCFFNCTCKFMGNAFVFAINADFQIKQTSVSYSSGDFTSKIDFKNMFSMPDSNFSYNTGLNAGDFYIKSQSPRSQIKILHCSFDNSYCNRLFSIAIIDSEFSYCNIVDNNLSYRTFSDFYTLFETFCGDIVGLVEPRFYDVNSCYIVNNRFSPNDSEFTFINRFGSGSNCSDLPINVNIENCYIDPKPIFKDSTSNSFTNVLPNKNAFDGDPTCHPSFWAVQSNDVKTSTQQFSMSSQFSQSEKFTSINHAKPTKSIIPTSKIHDVPINESTLKSINHVKSQSQIQIIDKQNAFRDKSQVSSNGRSTIIALGVTNGFLLLILLVLVILFFIYKTTKHAIESDGNECEEDELKTFDDKEESNTNQLSEDDHITPNEEECLDMNDNKDPESVNTTESLEEDNPSTLMNPNGLEAENAQDIAKFNEQSQIIPSTIVTSEYQDHIEQYELSDQTHVIAPPEVHECDGSQVLTEMFDQAQKHEGLINEQESLSLIATSFALQQNLGNENQSFSEQEPTKDIFEESPGVDKSATNMRRKRRRNLDNTNSHRRLKVADSTDSLICEQDEAADENEGELAPKTARGRRIRKKRAQSSDPKQEEAEEGQGDIIPDFEPSQTKAKRRKRAKIVQDPLVEDET